MHKSVKTAPSPIISTFVASCRGRANPLLLPASGALGARLTKAMPRGRWVFLSRTRLASARGGHVRMMRIPSSGKLVLACAGFRQEELHHIFLEGFGRKVPDAVPQLDLCASPDFLSSTPI